MIELDKDKIIEYIKSYSCVTFDIFDTLIKRDTDLFKDIVYIMNRDYYSITSKKLPVWFLRWRIHAPKVARKKFAKKEVSLDEIYDVIPIDDKELIKSLEVNAEYEVAEKNKVIYDVYLYCLKTDKDIYAISDMYLSKSDIRRMLTKCGYNIKKIYISQEYNATKKEGSLFEIFLTENDIRSNDVIHIGDNLNADVLGAKKNGIAALQIPNYRFRCKYNYLPQFRYSFKKNILYKSISNSIDDLDSVQAIGYEVLGPLLYYYANWLHTQIISSNIEKVYFLARDGYLIMEAYTLLFGEENVHYLNVSSKSVKKAFQNENNQRKYLVDYLRQKEMKGKVAIVDIGWSGRLHKMLVDITDEFAEIYGFYFGTFSAFDKNVCDGISKGYLNIDRIKLSKVYMNAGFIEILFSDTYCGSTERYENINGYINPVLSQSNPNGNVIRKLQHGAMEFVKNWNVSYFSNINYSSDELVDSLLRLSTYPIRDDVEKMSEEYAGSGNNYVKIADKVNKKDIKNFLECLKKTCWKGGFIDSNFKCSIVNKLYDILNSVMIYFKV